MEIWEKGWKVLFDTLEKLNFQDLEKNYIHKERRSYSNRVY